MLTKEQQQRKEALQRRRDASPEEKKRQASVGRLSSRFRDLHRTLIDRARDDYSALYGPPGSPVALLDLIKSHESFMWLRPMTEALVSLDEAIDRGAAQDERQAIENLHRLISFENPIFASQYRVVLQMDPEVAIARAALQRPLDEYLAS